MKNSPETLRKRNKLKRMWKRKIDINSFPHEIRRKCKECGKIKLCQWQHSFTQTGKPEYRARCRNCQKIYLKRIRSQEKYKNYRNKRRKEIQIERKKYAVDKLGGKCELCGYNKSLSVLTFHHRNPKGKEKTVGQMLDYSLKKLDRELKKCQLLCFNCHMELHEKLNET
ncbi:MAG: hypothetical protein IB617_01050 [Candidatus Nealsonbacteria bacterium]|nr:MAG: hypothetical protein IB617_01050 [Candidatus Nealsonbacteria bacterium]